MYLDIYACYLLSLAYQVEIAISGLHASLLVRHPNDKKKLFVNFDPDILTLMRETECISRMGLRVPFIAMPMKQKQSVFKKNFNKLEVHMSNILYVNFCKVYFS